ncbi:hypothetical protein EI42_01701 [Thermosporothrix hazakensis]|jgi:hypothetical protein|uniref:YdhG-like domain-containing protein n=2 Tax=Thermosporothrix TaxID=768650 RepID=A0A326UAL1_THEHA|nr:DUF1801 domain-containing protein [Thermosporothrix hazakensis]PZW32609.1 hypothetical protein EI42_01701 [Thermosporothrix hazakensis]BBH87521.1 hypothetical protein KTC_22720 [Thermosporothrix sp. COM3]GCE49962.1 hypothetical protein KTH_48310 [Thermosporothrix hazakensis]
MNPEITEYIEKIEQPWQVEACNRFRQIILQTVPEVEELKQYGRPHYKKNGKYLCVFNTAKKHVNVMLFHAQALSIPEGYGELSPNGERVTAKLQEGHQFDYDLFTKLLQEAAQTL